MMNDFCFVYVGKIEEYKNNQVLPFFARQEVDATDNIKVKNQKCAGYGLLRFALKDFLEWDEDFLTVRKNPNGKPECEEFNFSISHSHDLVAVAVASKNVGVDIEKVDNGKNLEGLKKTILHANEKNLKINTMEDLTALWTRKEAVFKLGGGKIFVPKDIDMSRSWAISNTVKYKDDTYCLGLALPTDKMVCKFNINV